MSPAKTKRKTLAAAPSLVVGVGASAGGNEALHDIFGAVPDDTNISFIVMLHIDPSASAMLPETLASYTKLPVEQLQDGMRMQAGYVYTCPGQSLVGLKNSVFQVEPLSADGRRNPIDRFFHALAKDQGDRAVAIVLSGMGSDGALGIKEVSKAGGMTLVQAPSTAAHTEMPQAAIDSGMVDHVLAPMNLAEELLAYAQHMQRSGDKMQFEALRAQVDEYLPQICEILLRVTGHNFRHYKINTLTRRIQRRIQVLKIHSVREYSELLERNEKEAHYLFNDLLIGVTAFFRDADAFESLTTEVFPRLFKDRKTDEPIRIWVPGCATGEEPYTLAMLLREYLDTLSIKPEVQIFATDIDEEALRTARQGSYPLSIAEEIAPERLKRFLIKKGQHYHVSKEIRGMVLFSVHNLINDPPFSKLDMISCRNLLIYLGSHLQKKLIPLFHYALKPGGYLFLGPSENLSSHRELFRPVNAKHRISQRLPTAVSASAFLTGRSGPPTLVKPPNVANNTETDTYLLMQRVILDEFAPKGLIVDEEGQIICASGNLEKYLTVSAGAFHNNAMRLVREGLRIGLRTTLAEAVKVRRQIVHNGLSLRTNEGTQRIMLTVQPMPHMGDDSGLFLVVFQDVGLPISGEVVSAVPNEEAGAIIEQLERELLTTREDLERTVQDLEAANEELKSSNEELLSMNEELQSANEELETSKEEVQFANETLNDVNSDLENLLISTQIATIFLDNASHVRRVTPQVAAIYNLLPTDIGRPLTHFTHQAKQMPSMPSIAAIQAAPKPIEDEVELKNGTWYLRRLLPYRTHEGIAEGILMTFTEVTEQKHAEIALRKSEERLQLVLTAAQFGVLNWDAKSDVVTLSPRAAEVFGINGSSTTRETLKRYVHPDDQARAQQVMDDAIKNHTNYAIEYRINRPDGAQLWILSTGRGEYDRKGTLTGMTRLVLDITNRKSAEQKLADSERLYRAIGESIDYGVWVCDAAGKNTYASPSFLKLLGVTQEECSAFKWGDILHPDDSKKTIAAWQKCVKEGWPLWDREHQFKGADGRWHPILARGVPVRNEQGKITGWVGINLDISRIKKVQASLRESEERFRKMADRAPVLIWMSDTNKSHTWFNQPWLGFVGRPMAKEIGDGWMQNVHPDDLARCMPIFVAAFDAREPFRMEYRLRRHDGSYRWVLDNGTPLYDADQTFTGYIGSCMDITDHKLAMETLQEADQRKDEFLATLAHELRNPLAPLSNGLQVMRMAGSSKPELLQQAQSMMERQVTHMVRLVDDLLDVSRITRGEIKLHLQPLNIATVIESALELSRPLIKSKEHTLETHLPKKPVMVMGDATRLSQVISNLLNNAAKYTIEGGHIDLRVNTKKHSFILSIKDNGIGIPEAMLPKIFDVFVQVDTALERSQGGLGIGLTLVRKLVELHGGHIEAKSDGPGQGSEFIITLPLSD